MKRGLIVDIVFIVLLALVLILANEFELNQVLFKYPFIVLLVVYFIGKYSTKLGSQDR